MEDLKYPIGKVVNLPFTEANKKHGLMPLK